MNEQLQSYIKQQLALGVSKETIIQNLKAQGGWSEEEVKRAFSSMLSVRENLTNSLSRIEVGILLFGSILFGLLSLFRLVPLSQFSLAFKSIVFLIVLFIFIILYLFQVLFFLKREYKFFILFSVITIYLLIPILALSNLIQIKSRFTVLIYFFFIPIYLLNFFFSQKKLVQRCILISQIVWMVVVIYIIYTSEYTSSLFSPDGGAIPCVTGVYNEKTNLCE